MRWTAPILALLALAAATPASAALADDLAFAEERYLRAAPGDIPRTPATEQAGRWNLVAYARVADGAALAAVFTVPPGAVVDEAACTCGDASFEPLQLNGTQVASAFVARAAGNAAGPQTMALRYHLAGAGETAFAVGGAGSWAAAVYVAEGWTVRAGLEPEVADLASTAENPGYRIWSFKGSGGGTWVAVAPAAAPVPEAPAVPWLWIVAGLVAGALLWAILVRGGFVQARSRKQVATVAAHEEVAARDPVPVLEGKRRALMAALKEVEVARMNQEMDVATYDAVKADLKRQAVTVMRALESGTKGDGTAA